MIRTTPLVSRLTVAVLALAAVNVATAWSGPAEQLAEAYKTGMSLYTTERFAEAAEQFKRTADLAPEVYGRGRYGAVNLNTAKLKEFLADCYLETLRLSEAEELFNVCLKVGAQEEGPRGEMAIRCKNKLGMLYGQLRQWDRAEAHYTEVLRQNSDRLGQAMTCNNLGYLYLEQDRPADAKPFFEWARKELEPKEPRDARLQLALSLHGLGMVAHQQREHRVAQDLFQAGLRERQRWLPEEHRWLAHSRGMLAAVHSHLGRDREALPLLEAAERAMRAFWGDHHVDVAMEEHELGLLFARTGDTAQAVGKFSASRRGFRAYIGATLKGLSTAEQLRFLAKERTRFVDCLAVALAHREDSSFVEPSLEWVLNEKGLVEETLAERQVLERQADRKLVAELDKLRQQLVALSSSARPQAELRRKLIVDESELVRKLGLQTRDKGSVGYWVEIADVRAMLAPDEALVEIVRLERDRPAVSVFDGQVAGGTARYVAWTLHGRNGGVELIDLGSAETIDAAVRTARQQIEKAPVAITTVGEPDAEATVTEVLKTLASRVLHPLLKGARDVKRLTLCPDGQLWLVPWAALPLLDGRYLVEAHELRYVVSGRDLVREAREPLRLQPSAIFADADFDIEPGQMASNSSELRAVTVRSSLADLPRVGSLPGTAAEAAAIEPSLETYGGARPRLHAGKGASESAFNELRFPSAVALCTHGFFLQPEAKPNGRGEPANPLLRCGLLLAGCNQRARATDTRNDGVLTGLEIVGADLRGTRLVVLSACETGVGEVRNGEGVAGLRQAFQLAGAQSVVSTLWKIPDRETALLMKDFFRDLAAKKDKAEALRHAQLTRIKARRESSDAAHPFFWAAFTLTGAAN
jgi:CHAT domain-containing protein/tetratricopeptide (TPR) repeat protein